jgi:glutathionylspermidine synthase
MTEVAVPTSSAEKLTRDELQALNLEYLIFDAFVGGVPRISLRPLILNSELHQAAVRTAEKAVRFLGGEVAQRAALDADEAAHYQFGSMTSRLIAASRSANDRAGLARVDLLLGEDGYWKVCEVNADCPGGHNEATGLPALARQRGLREVFNPTELVPALTQELIRLAAGGTVALVFATAYAEDLQVCAYLRRALQRRNVRALLVSPSALSRRGDQLLANGEPVSALYRFFPTEYFEDFPNALDIEHAVRAGTVRTLSSFGDMFLQSKMAMARAWALEDSLSNEARDFVQMHIPRTHALLDISRDRLVGTRSEWVIKCALGRVGDEVFVGSLLTQTDWVDCVDEARRRAASGEAWIVQRFVPQRRVSGAWGERLVTLGAYVLNGKFVGYFARLTQESHVSHDALVAPVFVHAVSSQLGEAA